MTKLEVAKTIAWSIAIVTALIAVAGWFVIMFYCIIVTIGFTYTVVALSNGIAFGFIASKR